MTPVPTQRLLVANRGEIAIRIMRTAAELGIETVAVYSEDDARSLHVSKADRAVALPGAGARAYLDAEQVVRAAVDAGCDALHPGYGFLSENADLARRCGEAGVVFVGPEPETLDLCGDKVRARELAERCGVPILRGSGPVDLDGARNFLASLDGRPALTKAVAGGGGRGMRVISNPDELERAFSRAQSEAKAAFGDGSLYMEELLPAARHIEVQVVGDGTGAVSHLWERDCSVQRRHQKLVEFAPAPGLESGLREAILGAAVTMASEARYRGLGTFEFLVPTGTRPAAGDFAFIEANARLQVEHTVTEEVTGLDLVAIQLAIAGGATLDDLGLRQTDIPAPRGLAVQLRINMEKVLPDGTLRPGGGTITAFEPPSGPGIRTDTFAYAGYTTSPAFDSLLAKLVVHTPTGDFATLARKAYRALCEARIEGVTTNTGFLQNLLVHRDFLANRVTTSFVDEHMAELAAGEGEGHRQLFVASDAPASATPSLAGVKVDPNDPLAVLEHGRAAAAARARAAAEKPAAGTDAVRAPLQGTIVSIDVTVDEPVRAGQQLLVMESMKMEHVISAPASGYVRRIDVAPGDAVVEGALLISLEEADVGDVATAETEEVDLDYIRPDLAEVLERQARALDAARPEAVARRRKTGQRTARENIDDLCDPGTFVEYGRLVLAAQRRRRSLEELIAKTPADGMVTGIGRINGDLFPEPDSRCVVMAYDYTVLAGTQGGQNHRKTDRMIDIAEDGRMPVVLFAEGGGGRPGDTDGVGVSTQRTFSRFAQLSGLVPLIGITSGRCFAGNASLLGCCDIIIATANSNIGMGGPAMIEGGGLGVFAPEDIGGMDVQVPNGVVDIAVEDEAEAVAVAKKYLSYFQGPLPTWEEPDQREMRRIVPENRLRVYDVRRVINTLADRDSVLELRPRFGVGIVTSLVRVEGRPLGIIANNPAHLGGAIDSDGSDKAARFMQLCDAFDIPLLYLCDTPGIMVGPEIEKTALVRHSSRMFLIGANLQVPFFTIVLRKAYGLGAIAMAGGSYKVPYFAVSWPTGEYGGMGLEGSVKLGYRDELAAIEDPEARRKRYEEMVAAAYERGKALNEASLFGVDDTIDPADSRHWVASLLRSIRPRPKGEGKRRPVIDAW